MLDLDKKELKSMPLEDISKATGLSIEEINEISNDVPTNRIVAPIKGSLESLSFTAPLILILAANAGRTHNKQKKAATENLKRNSFFIELRSTFLLRRQR